MRYLYTSSLRQATRSVDSRLVSLLRFLGGYRSLAEKAVHIFLCVLQEWEINLQRDKSRMSYCDELLQLVRQNAQSIAPLSITLVFSPDHLLTTY